MLSPTVREGVGFRVREWGGGDDRDGTKLLSNAARERCDEAAVSLSAASIGRSMGRTLRRSG